MPALTALGALAVRLLAQVGIAVSAAPEVGPRDPLLVKVEVTTPAGRDVQVEAPSFAPFRLLNAMRVASVDSTPPGGTYLRAPWQIVEFRYVLAPPPGAAGRYTFEPFVARALGRGLRPAVARSRTWDVTVRGLPPQPRAPAIVSRVTPRPRSGISFHALVVPETVFVGQQATYQVAVFLDEDVRTRLRRNPEFLPPELRSTIAYDLPAGRTSLRGQMIAGRDYDVHVFQRGVFALTAGRIAIPPAQLSYSLPLSSGFFSREESYTARSEPATILAVEPPAAGRPADWNGAVGALTAAARVDTNGARAGDPIVYTLRIQGAGNVKLLPRPRLDIPWASAVPSDERVVVDSTAVTVRGAKEFDWILTPREAGALRTPAVRYPYFDPDARRYEVAIADELPVTITPGALAQTPGSDSAAAPPLPIRLRLGDPAPTPLPSRPGFWALVLLMPLPAALVLLAKRPRRARPPQPPEKRLDELARPARRPGAEPRLRDVRSALAGAVFARLALPAGLTVAPGRLARVLRRRGVTAETAADAERLLLALDEGTYARVDTAVDVQDAARRARELFRRVDAEAQPRDSIRDDDPGRLDAAQAVGRVRPGRGGRAPLLALVVAGALGGAAAHAAQSAAAAEAFGRGVDAYRARRFAAAQREFAAAAEVAPRVVDAWANVGTAAWAAGDTVTAAVGWQRALRLDPLAADLRARLALLPAPQEGWLAGVPRVPPNAVLALAAALWAAGWLSAAVRGGRPRGGTSGPGWTRHATAGALVAATLVGAVGFAVLEATRPDRVAVVNAAGTLRSEPVLGAEAGPPVVATDVARVRGRAGVWTRVELDGDRAGWIETDRLVPLAE